MSARARWGASLTLVVVAAAVGTAAPSARAYQNPAVTLAGPSASVISLGGAAMSPDGRTGGVVWSERAGTLTHIFVAAYLGGRWRAPEQVDSGSLYGSSSPRIGAADDGQLVAAWVQEHGLDSDQLWAARLGAGSGSFDAPFVVDPDVGESTSTYPSIAVAPSGTAYVAYVGPHVEYDSAGRPIPPVLSSTGTLPLEYRLARIGGTSAVDFPALNRRPGALDPVPDASDAPQVAVDATGDGVVAWQEPDDLGIPRVWARRLYPRSVGSLAQVSPDTYAGAPLQAASDGFSVAMAGDGEGAIAYRQLPIAGSGLAAPRVLMARLLGVRPGAPAAASRGFGTPQLADGLGPAGSGLQSPPGAPQVSVSADGTVAVGYGTGTAVHLAGGTDTITAAATIGTATTSPATPAVVAGTAGAGVAAWPSDAAGGTVAIQERSATAVPQTGLASALLPGPVSAVDAAGSSGGDAIVAFAQGSADDGQIAAAVVDAPPAAFAVDPVAGWMSRRAAAVGWEAATAACGPVSYRVYVDGRLRAQTQATSADLSRSVPGDGIHHVRVIATDCHGQATGTPVASVSVDGTRPRIALSGAAAVRRGDRRALRVELSDGPRATASGIDRSRSTVEWGDGTLSTGAHLHHAYAHPGRYRVIVEAVDHAGNRRRLIRRVEVGS